MSVSPYTLNNLYQNGILDYIPMDLCAPIVGSSVQQNPYLNTAMQGNLYQQYGSSTDSFNASFTTNHQIGSQSGASIKNMFGFNGTGSQSETGLSMYGATGIGGQSNIGVSNTFGGFSDVSDSINNTITKVANAPKPIKGLTAAGLILLTIFGLFKSKKSSNTASTCSKWNLLNWFKKTAPAPAPAKTSIWSKIKNIFK